MKCAVLISFSILVTLTFSFPTSNNKNEVLHRKTRQANEVDDLNKNINRENTKKVNCNTPCVERGCYSPTKCSPCRRRCSNKRVSCNDEEITTPKIIKETITVPPEGTTINPSNSSKGVNRSRNKNSNTVDVNNKAENKADLLTNLLITNHLKNVNSVNIPIKVNERNLNVVNFPQQPEEETTVLIKIVDKTSKDVPVVVDKKDDLEIVDDEETVTKAFVDEVTIDPRNGFNDFNGFNNFNSFNGLDCVLNNCNNNVEDQCYLALYIGQYITICPNEFAVYRHLARNNKLQENPIEDLTQGCNSCLYCNGNYNPNECIKMNQCSSVCQNNLLNPDVKSPVKCTYSTSNEYSCKQVYF